jgi:hypothetical protein
MQREGDVPVSFVQNKMTRIASFDLSTKHLELLVRAALKNVFELCSLIASRSFSAPPNCNPHPDDRVLGLIFCQCPYSTILRGWPCQPSIPAGRPPCPTAPFSTYCHLLLDHHRPSRPEPRCPFCCSCPSHCLTTSRCLRRPLFPTFADNKSINHTA